jgi:hypothetical protein
MNQSQQFSELYHRAHSAGMAALVTTVPTPMVVVGGVPGEEPKRFYEPEGMCGFAWIRVRPGNCSFANWLKKNGKARSAYEGGVDIWVSEGNQSVERKERYARAFASVIEAANIPGVKGVYAQSRLD